MKALLLSLLGMAAAIVPLAAQDYAPFRIGHTPYFQAGDSIYSLRIANAFVQGGDSVFQFNPRAVQNNPTLLNGCDGSAPNNLAYIRSDNNIFGEQMVKTASGDFVFKFTQGDSMVLKPSAPINQAWVFSDAHTLSAMVTNRGVGQVHGLLDSVLTINLSNGDDILISKNFGLLQSRSFFDYRQGVTNPPALQLKALDGTPIGLPVSNPLNVFDFQPGDKFLYKTSQDAGNIMAPCFSGFATTEVLSRLDYPNGDSVVYQLKTQQLTVNTGYCTGIGYPAGTVLSPFDTISLSINPTQHSFLSSLSQEYIAFGMVSGLGMRYGPFNVGQFVTAYNDRIGSEFQMKTLDTCGAFYSDPYFPGSYLHRKFAAGIGQVFYHFYTYYGGDGLDYKSSLIAYIKGTETYGNWAPLVLANEEQLAQSQLQVYPNPFSSELTVQLPQLQQAPAEVAVYNLQGRLVHRLHLQVVEAQQQVSIEMPVVPAGLYLLQLHQGDRSWSVKVVRE